MRRITTTLTTLAAAAALTLTPAGTALAAQGTLHVGSNTYTNPPRGCYPASIFPTIVNNQTDTPVTAHEGLNCQGNITGRVDPGNSQLFEFGSSVFVPR